MLASRAVRAAALRVGDVGPAAGAAAVVFCALFFGGGSDPAPLVWLAGAAASLLALLVGWALLAKCVPALYDDYGRVARLRAPLTYWNELALLCDAGVPIALWLAARARRATGAVLLYGLVLTLLLTY